MKKVHPVIQVPLDKMVYLVIWVSLEVQEEAISLAHQVLTADLVKEEDLEKEDQKVLEVTLDNFEFPIVNAIV